ncbi:MAG: hypothetical protein HKN28_13010 [Alphaproteobacteria bacterium]|nr:hypothetical protein [Alphaproteobacteria bacterium]
MLMRSLNPLLILAFVATALTLSAGTALASEAAEKFYGSFVGQGTAERIREKVTEQRDLDVTVEAFKNGGFTIKWITVVRGSDGARVGDDVKRREVIENFIPLEDKQDVYVLAPKGGLFKKAELPNPLLGEPMRWATVENGAMTIYSMAIADNGGSELQVYRRTLTDKGMDISFLRMQDETVELRMEGTLVRTQ